ncbi:50S ribosomal protein L24 [Anaerocolumna cellulosilytica]|uniref:Large ribosomal subunit protein uL24 n=1 Tax=Anaerocolumna cellulosilytica TaxID=433286 RepID=A0A6S6QZI8_9FIRM|nr:50S ribosomal protein L24 [Anaerocolumna cellulosilytica]MBB5197343.1 large subunit ribosomal protein L24 [Anaerocolumna cellulosilytica]BCJ92785.1 50S ribosomal protein L24 [Anaerocolumna cellulosilytica]
MSTIKIKKGDNIKVITGKDKGKEGKVIAVMDSKVLVEGVNMITKHSKASQTNPKGGIIHQEAPIDISNVMYVHKGKVTRIGFTTVEGKKGPKKARIAKSTGEVID